MTCRAEAIGIAETTARALGLTDALAAHLEATYGVERLAQLPDDELRRALRFLSVLSERMPPRQMIPLPHGLAADGSWCMFNGRLTWERSP